ncbi:MAG: IPTL-CTERM sorting domain-containing protein, partial [Aeromicrobium sp.]|nr:IPTL-CTERM sorting domain-containing protein [Burkholderiales bacterium]
VTALTLTSAASTITGDGCYTGASTAVITGTTAVPCNAARTTERDNAVTAVNGQACTPLGGGAVNLNLVNLGGGLGPGVFPPGCYSSGGAMGVSAGTVTLSGAGVYIFRPTGTLTTAAGTTMAVTGGACESNVFWAPTGATTLGANTTFKGTILDSANAVTVLNAATMIGRILAPTGTITLGGGNTITRPPTCTTAPPVPIPTLSEWALIAFAMLIAGFGLFKQRQRRG